MDPVQIAAEALAALNAILNVIAQIRAAGALSDAALLTQAQELDNANEQLYSTLKAALNG